MSETPSPSDAGRRSERVMLEIPIRVICFGGSGGDFSEDSRTIFVNHDGGLIRLKHKVAPEDVVRIINLENMREADFRVAGAALSEAGKVSGWGVECLDKDRSLWGIDFPEPLTTGDARASALLECEGCGKKVLRVLTFTEVGMLDTAGRLDQLCDYCGQLSPWAYADVKRRPQQTPPVEEVEPVPRAEKWDHKTERRARKRVALKLPVFVQWAQGKSQVGKTEDVSKGGIAVCLGMMLALGDRVSVVCPYSGESEQLTQKAEVRRRVNLYAGQKWLYGLRYVRA